MFPDHEHTMTTLTMQNTSIMESPNKRAKHMNLQQKVAMRDSGITFNRSFLVLESRQLCYFLQIDREILKFKWRGLHWHLTL